MVFFSNLYWFSLIGCKYQYMISGVLRKITLAIHAAYSYKSALLGSALAASLLHTEHKARLALPSLRETLVFL